MRGFLCVVLASLLAAGPADAVVVVPVNVRMPVGGMPAAAAGARVPAQVDFGLTPPAIQDRFQRASAELVGKLDLVALVPETEAGFKNTVGAVEKAYAEYYEAMLPAFFLSSASPDPEVRDAVGRVRGASTDLLVEQSKRDDLYNVIKSYAEKGEELHGEDRRLLEDTMRDYRRSGMSLSLSERSKFKEVEKRLARLGRDFKRNLQEADGYLDVKPEELAGVPQGIMDGLRAAPDGKVRVPMESTVFGEVMRKADSARLRMKLYYAKQREAKKENLPVMEEALALRHDLARTLGYKNFAEYRLDGRMARHPRRVWKFLQKLRKMLFASAQAEDAEYLVRKRKEKPRATKMYPWDYSYYGHKMFKESMKMDPEEVRQYFPADHVVSETLEIYQELLGLKFKEVLPAAAWHPSVRKFEIRDARSGEFIGKFYLDLFPRHGKPAGAAAYPIVIGRELPDGDYRAPVSAILTNFPKAESGKPALLRHGNVKTFFHEFGHVMHQTLTATKRWSFAGSSVAQDFVEAPSQMMENFVWQPEIIARLSAHHADKSRKLPRELLEKLLAVRNYHSASGTLGQAAMAAFDLAYHSFAPVDVLQVFRKIEKYFTGHEPYRASTFPVRFGHIMGGYAAGYYGYLWSRVYAQDIFSKFKEDGVISPRVGRRYRETILEKGSSKDENELLEDFLGREPSEESFLRWLGASER